MKAVVAVKAIVLLRKIKLINLMKPGTKRMKFKNYIKRKIRSLILMINYF